MEYLSLYKANFIKDIDEKKLFKERFDASNTLHFDMTIKDKPSFLYLNQEMILLIEDILSLNAQIIKTRHKAKTNRIQNWELYHSLIEEIMITNEMEGIASTRKEIVELLEIKKPKEYKRLYGLVNKYRDIYTNTNTFSPITDSNKLRDIYDNILLQDIEREDPKDIPDGVIFRKELVHVQGPTKIIHTGLYPEDKIIKSIDNTLEILNNEQISLLLRVALFHYFIGYIHPFYDGNGRIARYISSYYLSQLLDPMAALRLSIGCKKRQKDYYEAYKITNDIKNNGDITYFVMTFLDIYKEALQDYLDDLTDKVNRYLYYKQQQSSLEIDDNSKMILRIITNYTLLQLEDIDLAKLVSLTKLSKSTVSNKVKKLEQQGYLIRHREGKRTLFSYDLDSL